MSREARSTIRVHVEWLMRRFVALSMLCNVAVYLLGQMYGVPRRRNVNSQYLSSDANICIGRSPIRGGSHNQSPLVVWSSRQLLEISLFADRRISNHVSLDFRGFSFSRAVMGGGGMNLRFLFIYRRSISISRVTAHRVDTRVFGSVWFLSRKCRVFFFPNLFIVGSYAEDPCARECDYFLLADQNAIFVGGDSGF